MTKDAFKADPEHFYSADIDCVVSPLTAPQVVKEEKEETTHDLVAHSIGRFLDRCVQVIKHIMGGEK